MSEPVQITIEQVRVGDTIRIVRTFDDVSMAWEGPVFEVKPEVRIGRCGAYHIDAMTGSNVAIHLIHRPPTRRAITIDDLKDRQKVPIGTLIEFEVDDLYGVRKGRISNRTESATHWTVSLEPRGSIFINCIKPGTLFVIEEAKP